MKMSAAWFSAALLLISLPGLAEPQPDGDGDGVPDVNDVCQHTPPHAVVDSQGCATDEDFDGIPDGLDQCPHSDFGTAVDVDGCSATQRSSRPAVAAPPVAAAPSPSPAPAPKPAPAPAIVMPTAPAAPVAVAPVPPAPAKRAPAVIAAPLPDGSLAAMPSSIPMTAVAPEAPAAAPPPPKSVAPPAATPAPAAAAAPAVSSDDEQRALLEDIDRRESAREAAEAAAVSAPVAAAIAAAPVATPAAAEPAALMDRDSHLFSEVLFAAGKSDFAEADAASLRNALPQLIELMQRAPKMRLVVVGHADAKTERANADKLAAARALAVHAYLIRNGVSPKHSSRSSQGAAQPVVMRGDSGRNRRVEILVYTD